MDADLTYDTISFKNIYVSAFLTHGIIYIYPWGCQYKKEHSTSLGYDYACTTIYIIIWTKYLIATLVWTTVGKYIPITYFREHPIDTILLKLAGCMP